MSDLKYQMEITHLKQLLDGKYLQVNNLMHGIDCVYQDLLNDDIDGALITLKVMLGVDE